MAPLAACAHSAASDDLQGFVAEIGRCSPRTRVIVPKHFARMTF